MIKTLKIDEAMEMLGRGRLARLGCVAEGEAYVVPVHYYFDGECAYFHSLPGRKIDALRAHPRACLQVDEIDDNIRWRSVLAYGNYEEMNDPDERAGIVNNFMHRFPLLTPVESAVVHDAAPPGIITFRLRIDTVNGVKEG